MNFFLNKKKFNIFILSSIFIFFILINLTYFYLHFTSKIIVNDYAFNELFINYQAGFIRRGLLGEILWQLSNYFHISPISFFSVFFLFIYILQFYLFFKLFKKFILSKIIFFFIFLSPSLILFHIYSPDLYYIKDSIIKLVILLHASVFYYFLILKKRNEQYFEYLKYLILPIITFMIFTHEYQVFSISVHFLISIGAIDKNISLNKIIKAYSYLIIPFLLIIFSFGNQLQFENLSLILKKFDVELNPYLGGGIYKYLGGFYKWHFFYFSYRDFFNLFLSILLGILSFFVLFQHLIDKKILKFQTKFQKNYLVFFIPTLIPFLLTSDHGRNIGLVGFYLIAFYSILNLDKKKLLNLNNKIYNYLFLRIGLLIFVFFYIFMWKLGQFAGFGLQGQPNDIFQSSLFAEFIKFIKFSYQFIDMNIIALPEIRL
jgi:hypothetical protein